MDDTKIYKQIYLKVSKNFFFLYFMKAKILLNNSDAGFVNYVLYIIFHRRVASVKDLQPSGTLFTPLNYNTKLAYVILLNDGMYE